MSVPNCTYHNHCFKICSQRHNSNYFIKYAPKVLRGYISFVKTPIGGIWGPIAKKEQTCSIIDDCKPHEGHTNFKQKPLCCKCYFLTSLNVLWQVTNI